MRLTIGVLLAVLISPAAQAELIDEINDRGELRIAVPADTAPYAFKENEQLTGFDVELGQALAKELDLRAEFIETPVEQQVPGVVEGKYDITLDKANTQDGLDASNAFADDGRAVQFQKGNAAFESAVNNALERIKGDGRLEALEAKWLKDQAHSTAGQ